MDVKGFLGDVPTPTFRSPTEPRRELNMSSEDESVTNESIEQLDKSVLDTEDLFKVFDDWQTKRTLTSKRIFVSTSILVSSASWVGIDYTELTLFGLRIAGGTPIRFLFLIIATIVLSGIFYEFSRRIDISVRKARIAHIDRDLKELIEPFRAIKDVMERNNISSFTDLYFDFRDTLTASTKHNAIDVFRAIGFYRKNLSKAGLGLHAVTIGEQAIIYMISTYAIVSLIQSIFW